MTLVYTEGKCTSDADSTAHGDCLTVEFNDVLHDRQTKPRTAFVTVTTFLNGVKRSKNLVKAAKTAEVTFHSGGKS